MSDRILKVNAYTTLDLLDATAEGHDFCEHALAVLNVTAARKNPDAVTVQLELDNTDLDNLPAHADEVRLSPEQAREVAAALEEHAATVEAATEDE